MLMDKVVISGGPATLGALTVASNYGGGTGDFTDVTTPPLTIKHASGTVYPRVIHLSGSASVAVVYNYQTGKDVYWGEDTDTGTYYFRGRAVSMGRIVYTAATEFDIEADTADGSDTKVLSLAGGGDDNVNRGAVIKIAGNENVSQGNGFLELFAGNVAGGLINFRTGNAVTVGRFDQSTTARDTRFLVWDVDNAALERVSAGDADSGGVGFKLLRIAN